MSQLFDITVATKQLRLDTTGYGETTFTVTNTSSEAHRVATRLVTDNPKYQNGLKIERDSCKKAEMERPPSAYNGW